MRKWCKWFVLLALALFLCASAVQSQEVVSPSLVKYCQPVNTCGYDFTSMENASLGYIYTFDDWTCWNGLPVTDIHWWGSYWAAPVAGPPTAYSDWRQNADNGTDGFVVAILADIPADDPANPNGFSIPDLDNILWINYFYDDCNEAYDFTDVKVTDSNGDPKVWEDVYSYSVDISSDPFLQEEGETYWLVVAAIFDDSTRQWGWHETTCVTGDYAVQADLTYEDHPGFYIPCGGHDMAFELTTVPEPGSLMALGIGLTSLAGMLIRRRRS